MSAALSKKVVRIAVPSLDYCPADFAIALATLCNHPLEGASLQGIVHVRNSNFHEARNMAAARAIEDGASHILWLDSDMVYPSATLARLLAHEAPIVGASYVSRSPGNALLGRQGNDLPLDLTSAEALVPMRHMPFGVMLTSVDVFAAIPRPWFRWLYPEGEFHEELSEDIYFCRTASAAGFQILCDIGLTREIGHVGAHTFRACA